MLQNGILFVKIGADTTRWRSGANLAKPAKFRWLTRDLGEIEKELQSSFPNEIAHCHEAQINSSSSGPIIPPALHSYLAFSGACVYWAARRKIRLALEAKCTWNGPRATIRSAPPLSPPVSNSSEPRRSLAKFYFMGFVVSLYEIRNWSDLRFVSWNQFS